jgi:hypothetical protein
MAILNSYMPRHRRPMALLPDFSAIERAFVHETRIVQAVELLSTTDSPESRELYRRLHAGDFGRNIVDRSARAA